jgi:hypothetical protein
MSTPTSWTEVPDPGGPAANRDGPGYEVRKGYVHAGYGFGAGPSVLAVGDVFTTASGGTFTVEAINLGGQPWGGYDPDDTVTLSGGVGTIAIVRLLGMTSYAPTGGVRSYVRTYAASSLAVFGTQVPQ